MKKVTTTHIEYKKVNDDWLESKKHVTIIEEDDGTFPRYQQDSPYNPSHPQYIKVWNSAQDAKH